jgi:hemoglobin-like flavoprotein
MPIFKDLGARHKGYGTITEHYPLVGEILINTFAEYLQEDWTPELAKAWLDIYTTVSNLMLEGAGVDTAQLNQKPDINKTVSIPKISVSLPHEKISKLSTNQEIELIEISFEKIKSCGEEFAGSFYKNLFTIYPETKRLFTKTDIDKQGKKLLNSLILLVEGLRTPETLVPVLKDLGARHKGYGVVTEYYPLMGDILLDTFAQYLQEDWTPELAKAWLNIYTTVSNLMLEGAGVKIIEKAPQINSNTIDNEEEKRSVNSLSNSLIPQANINQFQVFNSLFKIIKPLINSFKYSLQKLLDLFWEAPTWLVAIITVIILIILVLFSPEGSAIATIVGSIEGVTIIAAFVLYIKEIPDRKKEFHYQAWSVIDSANGVRVSPARIMALQDLNEDKVSLNNVEIINAQLTRINLSKADLREANLIKCDLNHADFKYANLDNALLGRTNFTGADLSHANLSFAKLSFANLSSANLSNAKLICADLRDTNLAGVNLNNANLSGANMKNAYLTGANLLGANVSEYDLRGAYLKGAIMPDGLKHP